MSNHSARMAFVGAALVGLCVAFVRAREPGAEKERKVAEAEVPKAALIALKKLAGDSPIKKYEEETEHGMKYYEGAWDTPGGKHEAVVTASGDLMETEESVTADKVPSAVVDAAKKAAGDAATIRWEKKTTIVYEAKFKKGDEKHEIALTPDGRTVEDGEDDDND